MRELGAAVFRNWPQAYALGLAAFKSPMRELGAAVFRN